MQTLQYPHQKNNFFMSKSVLAIFCVLCLLLILLQKINSKKASQFQFNFF
jgi:hypothetical protein